MKRKKTVTDVSKINIAKYCMLGTSALSFIVGVLLIWTNPQFTTKERDLSIYQGGNEASVLDIEPDKKSRNIGLILMLSSVLTGGLSLCIDGDREFDTASDTKQLTQPVKTVFNEAATPGITPEQSAILDTKREAFIDKLQTKIQNLPWLAQTIAAPSLVIVGGTGSGKSRLAQMIALFQCILQKGTLKIGDLDAYQNLDRGAWIAGDVYGEKAANAPSMPDVTQGQVSSIKKLLEIAYGGTRSETSPWETYIWDELIKWISDPFLTSALQDLMAFGVATTRKRNQGFIYLAHGMRKGVFGGESNASGILSRLIAVSPVIYLPTRKNLWGKAVKEDYFFFKAAGVEVPAEEPTKANHAGWELFDFPKELDPSTLGKALGPLFGHFNLSLVTQADRDKVKGTAQSQELRTEMLDQFEGVRELQKLEKQNEEMEVMDDPISYLTGLLTLERSNDPIPVTELSDLSQKLYRYCQGKSLIGNPISIDTVYRNWRKTGGFEGKGAKQNFLAFLRNASGIEIIDEKTFTFNVIEE